jgi:acetyl esterase/lipase
MHHRAGSLLFILCPVAIAVVAFAMQTPNSPQNPNASDILTRPAPPADHRIAYGSGEFQFGELRLPKNADDAKAQYPVVVILHGGCWLSQYGLSYMSHLAADLSRAGIATWNLEYRRLGNPGGGWPGTFDDVSRGADHLRELAKIYPLNLRRTVILGHSAGGHLALWLAARRNFPKGWAFYMAVPLPLRGVISLAGIADLRRTGTACDKEVARVMEGGPVYTQLSPIELLPFRVPSLIVQGDADPIIPTPMATEFVEAARKKGDATQLMLMEKAGHFELVDPQSSVWPLVRREVVRLLQ